LTVAAASSSTCSYSASGLDGNETSNTATATINGFGVSGVASVTWGNPTSEVDESITVTDDLYGGTLAVVTVTGYGTGLSAGSLGAGVNATNQTGPAVLLEYSKQLGPFDEQQCGPQRITNTATITTNDSQTTDTATSDVNFQVRCPEGCTLTLGYWKTHNELFWGGAPEDDAWYLIGDVDGNGLSEGPSETFYHSGQTWFEVFWTSPQGGNAYYQLAHQYMAAKLNILNGASAPSSVTGAIAAAEAYFANPVNTPLTAAELKGKAAKDLRTLASTLASYNEGLIGPGHCDEDRTSTLAFVLPALGLLGFGIQRGRHRRSRR
jgi:hypothetical protein